MRLSRALLFAAAAASLGVAAFILAQTSEPSRAAPFLLVFVAVALLFLAAHARLPSAPATARLYALAGASGLAGLGVLTGWGAGVLSFPAAALGVVAAASTFRSADRRLVAIVGLGYLAPGAIVALTTPLSFFTPFVVLLWPVIVMLAPPGSFAIFGTLGVSAALAALALARDRGAPPWRLRPTALALAAALAGGAAAVAVTVAVANVDSASSARFELVPIALAVTFLAGAGAGLALGSWRDAPPLAALGAGLAVSIGLFVLSGGPAVRCAPHGASASASGPWWLGPSSGAVSSSGSSDASASRSSGELRRGDGVVIRYACDGGRLVEFGIER